MSKRMSDFRVVAIGASAGGLDPVRLITEALPRNCGAAVIVVMHVGSGQSDLPEILNWHGKLPATFGREGEAIEPGRLYVAPPDRHMLVVAPGVIHLDAGPRVHNARPAIDPLFASVAGIYGRRVVGVVLSGRGEDGAAGLLMIHNRGGLALVQDPVEAAEPGMPAAAFARDDPEVLPIEQLSRRVFQFCSGTTVARVGDEPLVAGVPPRLAVRVSREGF
jgi:two-component system, chemotaxis family, protein-glutamate methylesterase/glutaminase